MLTTTGFAQLSDCDARELVAAELGRGLRPPPLPAYDGQQFRRLTARLDHDARFCAAPGVLPLMRLFLHSVHNGWLLIGDGVDGVILTSDRRIVRPVSCFSEPGRSNNGGVAIDLPMGENLDDVFVGFDAAWSNYYHWTCFAVGKSALAARVLTDSTIILPDPTVRGPTSYAPATWHASLARFGLATRIAALPPGAYRARRIRFLWTEFEVPTDILYLRTLHDVFPRARRRAPGATGRRLLIGRVVTNQPRLDADAAELVERVGARHGFELCRFETMDYDAQVEAMRDATHIIAAHGAGLANLVHATEGARVLELNAPIDDGPWLRPWYYQLALMRGLPYLFLNGGQGEFSERHLNQAVERLVAE